MLSPGLRVPRAPKIAKLVTGYVEELEQNLLKDLVPGSKLSVAYDVWTSPNNYSFIAIVGYFIDKSWRLREVLLGFEQLVGPHAGRNIGEVILEVLEKYGVRDRINAITTDNASNNSTAVSFMRRYIGGTMPTYHLPCLAHVLQLSLGALLASLKASPENDAEVEVWNDDLIGFVRRQTGIVQVIEKVRLSVISFHAELIYFY